MKNLNKQRLVNILLFLEKQCFQFPYSLRNIQACLSNSSYYIFLLCKRLSSNCADFQIIKFNDSLWNSSLSVADYKTYIPIKNQKIHIGYAIIYTQPEEKQIELYRIGIMPEYRKYGLATFLLKTILKDFFFDQNYQKILLEVASRNQTAIQLYQKFGFTPIRIRKQYFFNQDDCICMELDNNHYKKSLFFQAYQKHYT